MLNPLLVTRIAGVFFAWICLHINMSHSQLTIVGVIIECLALVTEKDIINHKAASKQLIIL